MVRRSAGLSLQSGSRLLKMSCFPVSYGAGNNMQREILKVVGGEHF